MRPTVYGERIPKLTPREIQVMQLRDRVMKTREIAKHLGISPKTVEQHLAHVRQKLRRTAEEM